MPQYRQATDSIHTCICKGYMDRKMFKILECLGIYSFVHTKDFLTAQFFSEIKRLHQTITLTKLDNACKHNVKYLKYLQRNAQFKCTFVNVACTFVCQPPYISGLVILQNGHGSLTVSSQNLRISTKQGYLKKHFHTHKAIILQEASVLGIVL